MDQGEPFKKPVAEGRIELRAYRENPELRTREAFAFYRVLLGHHHRGGIAKLQVRRLQVPAMFLR